MSSTGTRDLITVAVARLQADVPALRKLQLVAKVELRTHGGDTPIWRVEVPGPKVTKDPATDARIDITIDRPHFNALADQARLSDWVDAWEHGHVKVTGDRAVVKLLGNVIERQQVRSAG